MYAREHDSAQMKVRMTYCNMETEELRYFVNTYQRAELDEWFEALLTSIKMGGFLLTNGRSKGLLPFGSLRFLSLTEGQKNWLPMYTEVSFISASCSLKPYRSSKTPPPYFPLLRP